MASNLADASNIRPNAPIRFLIIGAGSRGNAYAWALTQSTKDAQISAVAEPIDSKRRSFGQKYIWGSGSPAPHQAFGGWSEYLDFAMSSRAEEVPKIDAVFVCTLDETHVEIITALAPHGYHIMSEKPLATTLKDCLRIRRSLQPPGQKNPDHVFSIGHVLHYSPHNMLLRSLLLKDAVIGDIISIEHTEPVGYWHFAHSYVRGNWRRESTSAPSLLTKSCHDIDFLLWLLCAMPASCFSQDLHLPARVTSTGGLFYFKPSRKPAAADGATNCYNCSAEPNCIYSAKKVYVDGQFRQGNGNWPVSIVEPEVEDLYLAGQKDAALTLLEKRLREDYRERTAATDRRGWYGRCVYNANNDVCDDQTVIMTWDEDPHPAVSDRSMQEQLHGRGAKTAVFRMVAWTEKQCERRGRIYGTKGEIEYDSKRIRVYDFATKQAQVHHPPQPGGGHGGGDSGLAMAFFRAVEAVKQQRMSVLEAQRLHIGCSLDDIIRSHAMVFAAEEARKARRTIDWAEWWQQNVETHV